jgi:hypothetical protein
MTLAAPRENIYGSQPAYLAGDADLSMPHGTFMFAEDRADDLSSQIDVTGGVRAA